MALAPEEAAAFAQLGWFERLAFRAMSSLNRSALGRVWQRAIVTPLVGLLVKRRLRVHGLERIESIPEGASILLVANHRTFFDLFILGWVLVTHPRLRRRVNFPVRANFFYENPLGLLICMSMTGGSMFPPFFRSAAKKGMNRHSLEILLDKLRSPGEMVGFHPEGTRNKTADPYTLLPAQPGAGELALKARPQVIPAFILGMTNSVWSEVKAEWRGQPEIVAVFGAPMEVPRFPGETRLSHHKRFADAIANRIAALGAEERAIRSGASRPASPA